jgi:hypothetical protein
VLDVFRHCSQAQTPLEDPKPATYLTDALSQLEPTATAPDTPQDKPEAVTPPEGAEVEPADATPPLDAAPEEPAPTAAAGNPGQSSSSEFRCTGHSAVNFVSDCLQR